MNWSQKDRERVSSQFWLLKCKTLLNSYIKVWRLHMLDVCVICKEGGRKKRGEARTSVSTQAGVMRSSAGMQPPNAEISRAGELGTALLFIWPDPAFAARLRQLLAERSFCPAARNLLQIFTVRGNAKAWPSAMQTVAIKFTAHSWISRPFKLGKIYTLPLLMRSCCQRLLAIYAVNVWISWSHSSESCAVI